MKHLHLHLELKVCEGCGILWIRGVNIDCVYCAACARQLVGFPAPRRIHGGGCPRSLRPVTARSLSRRCSGGAQ
jgi:hypothetical protein